MNVWSRRVRSRSSFGNLRKWSVVFGGAGFGPCRIGARGSVRRSGCGRRRVLGGGRRVVF